MNWYKIILVEMSTGRVLKSFVDETKQSMATARNEALNLIPDSFKGKGVNCIIINLDSDNAKVFNVLNGNYDPRLLSARPKMSNTKKLKTKSKQTGSSDRQADKQRTAKPVGYRKSATGKVYKETRANRSDVDKRKRL